MNRKSKTRLLSSIAIFISGYTPLFLIMIIKDIKEVVWFEHAFESVVWSFSKLKIPYWFEFKNIEIVLALLLLSVASLVLISYVLRNVTKRPFAINVISAKSRSSEVVNYTIPYIISFVAFDLSK
ncbi:hypothetical protein [Vibrio sp.]|uniref:hypothetical protein n=1 Tax=Vibrio sp. TaxID=678 RepID=UPI00311E5E4D